MSRVLDALKALLKDVAALGTQGNAALVSALAAGIVAVAAKLLGAAVTVPEVTGWILLAAGIAAGIEKLVGN